MFRSYEPGRDGLRHADRELPAAAGRLRRPQLLPAGPGRALRDPRRQRRRREGGPDLPVPLQQQARGATARCRSAARTVAIPLIQTSARSPTLDRRRLNVNETYTLDLVRGDRRGRRSGRVTNAGGGSEAFDKPIDYIGTKTLGSPATTRRTPRSTSTTSTFPGCRRRSTVACSSASARRASRSTSASSSTWSTRPLDGDHGTGDADQRRAANTIDDKNITTIALEVHKSCLTAAGDDPVIGAWTTASLRQARVIEPAAGTFRPADGDGGAWTQVSRLGMPLVNEVVIGLQDKDRFNGSRARRTTRSSPTTSRTRRCPR